eukprot:TRINITY_DN344_c0_g2_i1.p1 TRINITY_DN344_c0_g2~~TRINITY_DN344_c0_g2_i1.p1  ORF type:complete len:429 (-),score=82.71 TRINITY_DN344_c0_g2_i1:129-1235(-)
MRSPSAPQRRLSGLRSAPAVALLRVALAACIFGRSADATAVVRRERLDPPHDGSSAAPDHGLVGDDHEHQRKRVQELVAAALERRNKEAAQQQAGHGEAAKAAEPSMFDASSEAAAWSADPVAQRKRLTALMSHADTATVQRAMDKILAGDLKGALSDLGDPAGAAGLVPPSEEQKIQNELREVGRALKQTGRATVNMTASLSAATTRQSAPAEPLPREPAASKPAAAEEVDAEEDFEDEEPPASRLHVFVSTTVILAMASALAFLAWYVSPKKEKAASKPDVAISVRDLKDLSDIYSISKNGEKVGSLKGPHLDISKQDVIAKQEGATATPVTLAERIERAGEVRATVAAEAATRLAAAARDASAAN